MYGAAINNLNMTDIKYFFHKELNPKDFVPYDGNNNQMGLAIMNKTKFKQLKLDDYENSKIFIRKKTPFNNNVEAIHQGADESFSSALGLDCLFIEKRGGVYYIVAVNPNDFIFKEYRKCNFITSTGLYGLEIFNEKNEKLYTSNLTPCLLKSVIDVNSICKDDVFVKITNSNYSNSNMLFNNLLELKQNPIISNGAFCELGITCGFNKLIDGRHWEYKELSGFYSLLIDSTGLLKYMLCFGHIAGSAGIIRGRNDFNGGTTVTISRSSKHIGLIS